MNKQFWLIFLPLATLLGLLFWGMNQSLVERYQAELMQTEHHQLHMMHEEAKGDLGTAAKGLILAKAQSLNHGYDFQKPLPFASELTQNLIAQLTNIEYYDQLSLLTPQGFERLKLQYEQGHILLLPQQRLGQNTSPSLAELQRLKPGQLYFSTLFTHAEPDHPQHVSLLMGIGFFDPQGSLRGLVTAHLLGQSLLAHLAELSAPESEFYLIGPEGIPLQPESQTKLPNLAQSQPELWALMQTQTQGHLWLGGSLYSFHRIEPLALIQDELSEIKEDTFTVAGFSGAWYFLSQRPKASVEADLNAQTQGLTHLFGFLLLAAALFSFFMAMLIRQRQRAQENVVYEREKLLKAQAITHMGTWEQRFATGTLDWTDGIYRLIGEEPRQQPPNMLRLYMQIPEVEREELLFRLEQSLLHDASFTYEHHLVRENGETRVIRARCEPLYDSKGTKAGLLGTLQDITEQKRNEDILRKAIEEAHRANLAKSTFLANMSHEIRTPLNAVLGFAELLAPLLTEPKQKQYLATIEASGRNLLVLISDILDLVKLDSGLMTMQPGPVQLLPLLEEQLQLFEPQAKKKGLQLHLSARELPAVVLLDEARLRQVLFNLLGNAVKFTTKGEVRLEVRSKPSLTEGRVQLRFTVRDTGPGIALADQARIFDAFSQTEGQSNRRHGGTGLGLAICQQLVRCLGGELGVESVLGQGASFSFSLPEVPLSGKAPRKITHLAGEVRFQGQKVLVADDVLHNRLLIREILKKYHLEILEAEDGEMACQMAAQLHPDLILMDLQMPHVSGEEALHRLKAQPETSSIPVVALSASVLEDSYQAMLDLGFDGSAAKPIIKKQLLGELSRFLAHQTLEAPTSAEPKTQPLSPEAKAGLPRALVELEDFLGSWEELRQQNDIVEIKEQAEALAQLAAKHGLEPLVQKAQALAQAASLFDIVRTQELLIEIPRLVQEWMELPG